MNLFSTVLTLFGKKSGMANSDKGPQSGGASGTSTSAGISVTDERAMQVSAVWACVQYITNSVCSLPIEFHKRNKNGDREQLKDHYLVDLFHKRPNPLMKPRDLRKALTLQLALWQNAYAEIFYSGDRPVGLVPLRPGRMLPTLNDAGELSYHYTMQNGVRVYSPQRVLHLKGFSTEGIVGLERTEYARQTLGLSVSADTYAASQFKHGGRSGGGYLYVDKWLKPAQRDQARELYSNMSLTAFEKGDLWILEGGVKYEPDRVPPDTMQMIETRKMQLGEIARYFGVPEVMIGAGGATSAWPASFEQQLLSFLTFTLQDYLDEWESAIQYSLLVPKDRGAVFADHDTTGFIKMDSNAKAQLHASQVQNGIKTRNEVRRSLNLPTIEGADELTAQVNLTPVDQLEKVTGNANTAQTPSPAQRL